MVKLTWAPRIRYANCAKAKKTMKNMMEKAPTSPAHWGKIGFKFFKCEPVHREKT